jgi:hypothetical protein
MHGCNGGSQTSAQAEPTLSRMRLTAPPNFHLSPKGRGALQRAHARQVGCRGSDGHAAVDDRVVKLLQHEAEG